MRKSILLTIILLGLLLTAGCGLLPESNPQPPPQPTATDSPFKATPLSELPPTWTPAPTLTPTITFTPSPTTPPPTATPNWNDFDIQAMMTPVTSSVSQELPDTGSWETMTGSTASMKIPPGYEVLDLGEGFGELMSALFGAFIEGFSELASEMGEELTGTPLPVEDPPELEELPAFDFLIAVDPTGMNAFILTGSAYNEGLTTEGLINQSLTESDNEPQLISREVLTDAPYPMERVILEVDDPELGPGRQAIYAVLGDQAAWTVVYAAPAADFEAGLLEAEAAVLSISPIE